MRLILAGQSLVKRDLRLADKTAFSQLAALVGSADIAFTNFEGVIAGADGAWPTKDKFIHEAPADALAGLRAIGFNLLSMANNHAYDLGAAGIVHSLKVAESLGFGVAGSGPDLARAGRAAIVDTPAGRCGLVAMDASGLPDLAYACDGGTRVGARPGINPLRIRRTVRLPNKLFSELEDIAEAIGGAERSRRRLAKGYPEACADDRLNFYGAWLKGGEPAAEDFEALPEDLQRNLEVIEAASRKTDCTIAYVHQHHWSPNWQATPDWLRRIGRECIEAGATVFVSHGVPMPLAIEFHRGRPLFLGLGNFIFDTFRPERYTEATVWQSVLADCRIGSSDVELVLHPIAIDFEGLSQPRQAAADEASSILAEFKRLSPRLTFTQLADGAIACSLADHP